MTCNIDFPTLEGLDQLPEVDFNRIQFRKFFNIQHIKCIVTAIASGVKDSDLAKEWIVYNIELVETIERMIICGKLTVTKRNM